MNRQAVLGLLSGRSAIAKRQEADNLARIWARPRPIELPARPA